MAKVIRPRKVGSNRAVEKRLQDQLRELTKVRYILVAPLCAHALESAMMVLGIKRGDKPSAPVSILWLLQTLSSDKRQDLYLLRLKRII